MRMGLLAVAGWLVAAVLMVAVSWSAIGVVRTAVVPGGTVAAGLPTPYETPVPTATAATPSRTPTATPAPTPPAGRTALASGTGGTATVRCAAGAPAFVNVTPRQGWSVHRDEGPGRVRFDGPSGARTEITAICAGGTPRTSVEERGARGGGGDDDDSGGSDGGDGGDGGDDGDGNDDD